MASCKSINQTTLAGIVGAKISRTQVQPAGEPEPKTVINFSLRTQEIFSREGEVEEDWHNISFYGQIADKLNEVLEPGILLYVTGRTRNRTYIDKNKNKKFGSNVVGKEFSVLNGIPEGYTPK